MARDDQQRPSVAAGDSLSVGSVDETLDRVSIHALEASCIVGILPSERAAAQALELDIHFDLDVRNAGRSGRIDASCDYVTAADGVRQLLEFRRYGLLETAVEELCAMLLETQPRARAVELAVKKPGALGPFAAGASVRARRQRSPVPAISEAFGRSRVLIETFESVLEAVDVDPGCSWRAPRLPTNARSIAWTIRGEVHRVASPGTDGDACEAGVPIAGGGHLLNVGRGSATILRCVTRA